MKNLLLIICCFIFTGAANAQTGLIFTIAGNGNTGYTGDSGQATSATFSFPDMMVIDPARNIYISDRDNHVIRKVNAAGVITTFAGNGFPGISGDNGLAVNAELAAAYGLALDRNNNLYIADETVRKVNVTTGIITTIAGGGSNDPGDGGPATAAITENVHQITFDAAGNLYITDGRHFSIRKVDVNGIITTVAGNGTQGCSGDGGLATQAQLKQPEGVAVDAAGNIFIADAQSNNIRRVDATTHLISTICGDPAGIDGGGNGDGGPARLAELMMPSCLQFDRFGNLFINDSQNQEVRKISTTGTITTIAGHGFGGTNTDLDNVPATDDMLFNPMGIAFDPFGNLYIAEASREKVRIITLAASAVQSVADIELKCYPNPVNDLLTVQSADFKEGEVTAQVYNLTGQLVDVVSTVTGNTMQLKTHNLAPGMYFMNALTASGTGTVRFVKQ